MSVLNELFDLFCFVMEIINDNIVFLTKEIFLGSLTKNPVDS